MKKISNYILKYWFMYTIAVICMVLAISLDMLSPQITRLIIDDVIIGGNLSILTKLLLGILLVGIGKCVFQYFKEFIFDATSSKIGADMRRNLFEHIQNLSISFFDKNNTGELMARVKDDVDKICNVLGFIGMLVLEVIIHTVIVIYCMFRLSPKLSIVPLVIMPIIAVIAILMEKKLGNIYEEISDENAVLNTVAEENIAGVRTVKAFARERHEIKKFLSHNENYYNLSMKQAKVLVQYYPYFQFLTKLLPIIIILFGGLLVINKEMTIGELGAFTEYSMNIVWPMELLGWLTNELSSAMASNNKLKKIYSEIPTVIETENPKILDKITGTIAFHKVNFSWGDKKVLEDISFTLEPGRTIGIMGATGAGKTSIINLLQRFYDSDSGSITLDGVDIKDLSLAQLRGCISYVMQDIFLFSDTIRENIGLGKRGKLTNEVMVSAADKASAKDFIEQMDKKYDTIIGERGIGLSGGQKQRISIARAIAKKSPVLVLDDSTSALDMETEHMIQEALLELTNTTKLIIAHRISAVRNADEIIILQNGKIAERGTHGELLKKRKLYYETYLAQYGDYLTEEMGV